MKKVNKGLPRSISESLEQGQFDDTLRLCDEALSREGASRTVYEARARALLGLERVDEVINYCTAALKNCPKSLILIDILGQAYLRKGQLREAGVCYQQTVEIEPSLVQGWFLLGAIYGQLGDIGRSLQCSRRVIELDPHNVDAHYNLAQGYMHQFRYRDAAEHYRKVVEKRADSFDAWNHLGMALHEFGQHEEAIPCFEEALRIRPDSEPTRFVLAAAKGDDAPSVAPSKYVRDLFDKYAENFDQQLVGDLQYKTPGLLNDLVRDVAGAAGQTGAGRRFTMLDFGCGTGLCGPLFRDIASRMVGVDLSPGMLEKAKGKQVYDDLITGDLGNLIDAGQAGNYDLIVGADVYPYIGSMEETLEQCEALLQANGILAISVEGETNTDTFVLRNTNRYAHNPNYVRAAAAGAGLKELCCKEAVLRMNRGQPVDGYLFVFGT